MNAPIEIYKAILAHFDISLAIFDTMKSPLSTTNT
jgi:hypothetical protein